MIKITFLGTADSVPSASRNHSSILLTYKGENILIDCGEGTQRQFRKAKLNPCKITKILITHWHADHVLGLPGLFKTLSLSGYQKKLTLFCPSGTKKRIESMLKLFNINLNIKVKEVNGVFFETNDFYLEAKKMDHKVPCNGYSFVKKGQRRIDKKKLEKLKLKPSKEFRKLKEGKSITVKGKKYHAKDLTFREGDKKITFILDTRINKNAISLAQKSDILISESTFNEELKEKAKEYKHLTAKDAATIAKKSKSKKLYLTHLSQRFDKDHSILLKEAKKTFKESFLVKDLDKISL